MIEGRKEGKGMLKRKKEREREREKKQLDALPSENLLRWTMA